MLLQAFKRVFSALKKKLLCYFQHGAGHSVVDDAQHALVHDEIITTGTAVQLG